MPGTLARMVQRHMCGLQPCCLPLPSRRRSLLSSAVWVFATTVLLSLLYFLFFYTSGGLLSTLSLPYGHHDQSEDYFRHVTQNRDATDPEEGAVEFVTWSKNNEGKPAPSEKDDPLYYDGRPNNSSVSVGSSPSKGNADFQFKEPEVKPLFLPRINFVKGKLDVLSRTGDEKDYLFPPCPSDDVQPINDTYGFLGPFRYLADYKNPCWMEQGEESPTVMCVPYFYLVGAPKAGSTDLYKRITMHPEVVNPSSKETRWFDRKRYLDQPHFSSFLKNYATASGVISRSLDRGTNYHRRIVGDGSPSYFFDNRNWPLVPGNEGCEEPRVTVGSHIRHLFPGARIIFILRNPVERLYSSYLYNHAKYEALSSRTFDLYVREAVKVYNDCFARYSLRACANNATVFQQAKVMLIVSLYSVFVQDWLQLFPREQLLFITTEQYNRDMDTHLRKIHTFLGLRQLSWGEMEGIRMHSAFNKGPHYKKTGPMLPETRTLLEDFYRPYNQQLANMLNDPEFLWMN